MVIYCSEGFINQVSKIREEYGLLDKTKIIKITLENNLYMADKLDKIRKNVAKNMPPYDIPEYILQLIPDMAIYKMQLKIIISKRIISHGSILAHLIL